MDSPLADHDVPLDRDHLKRMTLDDLALEREVLRIFVAQAGWLVDALAAQPVNASALAHTLSGSARAIGAFGVADQAAALEVALGRGEEVGEKLVALRAAVADARRTIETILKNSQ
jgi:HPt (histidine-containing phosphotransfer) domain-containing protein